MRTLLRAGIFALLLQASAVHAEPHRAVVSPIEDGLASWKVDRLPRDASLLPGSSGSRVRVPAVPRDPSALDDAAFRPTPSPSTDGTAVEQVIVTSLALEPSFQILADRETRRGVPTVVRTTEWILATYPGADDPARIRTFLREAYDFWGTRYVLLGGDSEIVPTRYVPWDDVEIPADYYYACVDGEWNEDGDAIFGEPTTAAAFNDYVNDVATAPDGRPWVGTYHGVAVLDNGAFQSWDETDGLPDPVVYSVDVADDGTVWAGGVSGAARFDGSVWQGFTSVDGVPGIVVAVDAISFTDVWVGTSMGLAHYDGVSWQTWGLAEGLPNLSVTAVRADSAGVWVGTAGGAARFESGSFTVYDTAGSGILSNWILAIEVDDLDRVWFGHGNNFFLRGGISRFDGVSWFTDDLPAWSGMSVRSFSIEPGGDEFWAATSGGLLHRTPGGDELLGTAEGLAATDCLSISNLAGAFAVATPAGLNTGTPGAWSVFTSAHGLPVAFIDYDDIDLFPELQVGRIPAETAAEVATYLQKLTDYQDGVHVDHVETALFLGENMLAPGDGKDACQALKALFPPGFTHQELYEIDGTENVAATVAALEAGPAWVIDAGHGSYDAMGVGPGQELLFNGDVRGTDPAGRASFLIVYACNSGAFDLESSSEAFLFHPTGGAIGVLANTREAVPTVDASLYEDHLADLFASSHGRPAQSFHDVWHTRIAEDPDAYSMETWWRRTLLTRTFQGAPTLSLWRAAPRALAVTHPGAVPLVRAPFTVHVADSATGNPVEGARVCVSKADEDYAYGMTDASGDVTFQIRPESLGDVDVVVTTPDHVPYEGITPVSSSSGPSPVADGANPTPARMIGPGSQVSLLLALRNVGLASVSGWSLQLASNDPEVSVVSGPDSLDALDAGETTWVGPFVLTVGTDLVNGEKFTVQLDGSGEVAFSETYAVVVEASDLTLDSLDLGSGTILPVVTNHGAISTGALTATLTSLDTLGVVVDSLGASPGAAAGETVTFPDGFTVTGPDDARFQLSIVDAAGRTIVAIVDRTAPGPISGLASEPRDGGAALTWAASPSSDVIGYLVEFSPSPGTWIDEFGGPVTQGSLARVQFGTASRDYRVTAVDEGGNRSGSVTITAYAALPALPGWPRRLPSRIGPSAVVVSDLDGDDSPEVTIGSMWETNAAHVFRADGVEWTDGDEDPSTDGVFGVTQGRVNAAVLAVDVDNDGSKEIFAPSYDGTVYGWRTDGTGGGTPTALPGWPIYHTQMGVRTTPVAADLDADQDLEIVTVANDGMIRAFHADGTPVAGWPFATGRLNTGSTPAVADLNGDGRDDLVFGGTDSLLYVVSGDGTSFPGWPRPVGAKILASPVLVDLDEDDDYEVICQVRNGDIVAYHLDDTDGTPGADPVSGWPVTLVPYTSTPPSPAVADFDGDGVPEIVVAGGAELTVIRADGSLYPGFPLVMDFDVSNSPVVADLDGDESLDILIGTVGRRLWAFAIDGSVVPGWPRVFREVPMSTPAVVDMDRDGDLDVVLASNDMYLHVVDATGPATAAAAPWPGYQGGDAGGVYTPPPTGTGSPGPWMKPEVTLLSLGAPAPNPFRGVTALRFSLPQRGPVHLEIYDVTGRRVAAPLSGEVLPAGAHRIAWDGRDTLGRAVATGVYFLRLRAEGETRHGRAVRIR